MAQKLSVSDLMLIDNESCRGLHYSKIKRERGGATWYQIPLLGRLI
jgi:hypothetical protein